MEYHEITGLSRSQVNERISEGLDNDYSDTLSKSYFHIIRDNLFTLFNLISAIIGVCLFLVGAYANMLFLFIIVINITVGIIQEVIAKRLVENLSLINATRCTVIRDAKKVDIDVKEIVIDDILFLESGQIISCDSLIVMGSIEVNEALLTGESLPISKSTDEHLLSGSFVTSGQVYAKVINVGKNNYITKIASEAKKHKKIHSELMQAMNHAIKFSIYFIIPASIALLTKNLLVDHNSLSETVVATSAAVIGMLPMGVILLITTSLAVGVIKLSKMRILVQELYAVESLSRVNLICLDKTGTLTQGKMSLQETIIIDTDYTLYEIEDIMAQIIGASTENNATFTALKEAFEKPCTFRVFGQTHFSSQRKWSSVSLTSDSTYYLGGPDILFNAFDDTQTQALIQEGYRVIVLAKSDQLNDSDELLGSLVPIASFALADPLRANAKKTIQYFYEQGVKIRIISGDNPKTVSQIAKQVGIDDFEYYIDLTNINETQLETIAYKYSVFGRANPNQKKFLIKQFQKSGYTVAMTGDGVNDVLALRQADCSIAMGQGSSAAKQVSQLVLIDSDFSSIPHIIYEGRRVVNNMIKVSSIYFIKTFYSAFLTILAILSATTFPFIPVQLTLINALIVGIPTFFITFENSQQSITQNFYRVTLQNSLPSAFIILMMALLIKSLDISVAMQTSLLYYVVAYLTFIGVYRACLPLTKLKILLLSISMTSFILALWLLKPYLNLEKLNIDLIMNLSVLIGVSTVLLYTINVIIYKINEISEI